LTEKQLAQDRAFEAAKTSGESKPR
jgi:hypothetical protein